MKNLSIGQLKKKIRQHESAIDVQKAKIYQGYVSVKQNLTSPPGIAITLLLGFLGGYWLRKKIKQPAINKKVEKPQTAKAAHSGNSFSIAQIIDIVMLASTFVTIIRDKYKSKKV